MASTSSSVPIQLKLTHGSGGWEELNFDILNEIAEQEAEEKQKLEASTSDGARVQTATGQKLFPPFIRIDRCRCVECGNEPNFTCTQCRYLTMLCKKCARRANHPHSLKTFRKKDETFATLSRHLKLVYYNHVVKCERDICLPVCLQSREFRTHFQQCSARPAHPNDMIIDGQVKFDGTGFGSIECPKCGLFITYMFLHANDCKEEDCKVAWCNELRNIFDMETKQVWAISNSMKRKIKEVIMIEWNSVRERQQELVVQNLINDIRSVTM